MIIAVYIGKEASHTYDKFNKTKRFGTLKSDSTHHFFRNACTK
jgi:hypothetical protein